MDEIIGMLQAQRLPNPSAGVYIGDQSKLMEGARNASKLPSTTAPSPPKATAPPLTSTKSKATAPPLTSTELKAAAPPFELSTKRPVEGLPTNTNDIYYKALARHTATDMYEIDLEVNDIIKVRDKNENGWWWCENTRTKEVGLVPSNFLKLLEVNELENFLKTAKQPEDKPPIITEYVDYKYYWAPKQYNTENVDGLNVNAGDVLQVLNKTGEEWYCANTRTSDQGNVPSNILKPLSKEDPIPERANDYKIINQYADKIFIISYEINDRIVHGLLIIGIFDYKPSNIFNIIIKLKKSTVIPISDIYYFNLLNRNSTIENIYIKIDGKEHNIPISEIFNPIEYNNLVNKKIDFSIQGDYLVPNKIIDKLTIGEKVDVGDDNNKNTAIVYREVQNIYPDYKQPISSTASISNDVYAIYENQFKYLPKATVSSPPSTSLEESRKNDDLLFSNIDLNLTFGGVKNSGIYLYINVLNNSENTLQIGFDVDNKKGWVVLNKNTNTRLKEIDNILLLSKNTIINITIDTTTKTYNLCNINFLNNNEREKYMNAISDLESKSKSEYSAQILNDTNQGVQKKINITGDIGNLKTFTIIDERYTAVAIKSDDSDISDTMLTSDSSTPNWYRLSNLKIQLIFNKGSTITIPLTNPYADSLYTGKHEFSDITGRSEIPFGLIIKHLNKALLIILVILLIFIIYLQKTDQEVYEIVRPPNLL